MTKIEDYADAVELFLESQYYRHRAKERTAERERRRQPAQRWQPTAAQYWLTSAALDGLQQCDLAAALARRNPRLADALSTTIGDAVAATMQPWCEQCNLPANICRGHDLPPGMVIGGPALQLDASLSPSERFAQNVVRHVADEDCRHQLAMMQ